MTKKSIVIVESPAKSKTINKMLGPKYLVLSCMGHIIDLPKSKMGIDVKNDFKAEYSVIPERRKYLAKLKKEIRKSDVVYLGADPDREGEAISWHLKRELGKGKKVFRVVPLGISYISPQNPYFKGILSHILLISPSSLAIFILATEKYLSRPKFLSKIHNSSSISRNSARIFANF